MCSRARTRVAKTGLTCINGGAGEGTRTLKLSRAMAPKTIAFSDFATPAACRSYRSPRRQICRRSLLLWIHYGSERGVWVRSAEEFEAVQQLIKDGLNDCAIARQTGIPRKTVWEWRYCRSPIRARIPNASSPCGIDHDFAALPPAAYCYLLGLYLGDGCISRSGRVWRLRIMLDDKYPGSLSAVAWRSTF